MQSTLDHNVAHVSGLHFCTTLFLVVGTSAPEFRRFDAAQVLIYPSGETLTPKKEQFWTGVKRQ